MLSFKIITEENKDEVIDVLTTGMEDADLEYISEIVDSLLEDSDSEYALSCSHGCLLVRTFNGQYSFIYPIAVCGEADESLAAYYLREYAVKEEIPLVYTDVPKEELGSLVTLFRHANIDAQDLDGECFVVKIMSEAALLEDFPTFDFGEISLDEINEGDDVLYASLCKDKETNTFWGYDYSADNESPADSYFREMAENEFDRGVAVALAVRVNGEFAGEASLYAFDLIGGCECAIRILPEYRGKGVATKVVSAIRIIAERMGLLNLCATVDNRNEASKKLFEKCFDDSTKIGEKRKYYVKL